MTKQISNIFFIAFLIAAAISLRAFAYSGNGTVQDPYIIADYEDFCSIADKINNGDTFLAASNIKLGSSLDFSDRTFTPIGTADNPFTGVFDGDGYCLNDISYTAVDEAFGVFAYAENAVIKNLGVVDAEIILGSNSETVYCGIICGSFKKNEGNSDTDLEKCFATGKITVVAPSAGKAYAGGIAGSIVSSAVGAGITVSNCRTDCDITVRADSVYCGGFAGYAGTDKASATVKIEYLYTKGTLRASALGSDAFCGGMIGYLKAEESGWGEWMSDSEEAVLLSDSYALCCSISLCEVSADSDYGAAYSSYTVSQTESGPVSSNLYCTGVDNSTGGISGKTVSEDVVANSLFMADTVGFDMAGTWCMDGGLDLVRKAALCGSAAIDGKTAHIRANGFMKGNVFVAAYDSDGRMTEAEIHIADGSDSEMNVSFNAVPYEIKIFALDNGKLKPICEKALAR